jgi:hypothetical protein
MISWLNLASLILASILFTYYYVKSVRPASLEREIGHEAYSTKGKSAMKHIPSVAHTGSFPRPSCFSPL